jgi:aryl-alcohol dehydrogenase-like predicted oxidoreductase
MGHSGLAVSAVGLGCNNFGRAGTATADLAGTKAVVHAALDAGVRFFDVADTYGSVPGASEELLGAALHGVRDQAVVATKFGMWRAGMPSEAEPRTGRRYIIRAVEASLRRLGTDRIDLYQMHAPDPRTPIKETLRALDNLVRDGKVRYIGHSNLGGWQIAEAHFTASAARGFISAQNEYNLLARGAELEVLPAAARFGLGVLPFFPLANGLLSGKYRRDALPAHTRLVDIKPELAKTAPWDALDRLSEFAAARGITMLDVAFGWLLEIGRAHV